MTQEQEDPPITAPTIPAHYQAGLDKMNSGKPLAYLTDATRGDFARRVADRYLDGESMQDIADQYGVTRTRLYQIMLQADPETWRASQAPHALTDYEDSVKGIKEASDGLSLARARELNRAAQFRLEVLLRRLYGRDQASFAINAQGHVSVQIVNYADASDATPQQMQRTIDSTEV